MRVVIDTNIWISALLRSGNAAREIIRLSLTRRIQPIMGAALYAEYEAVMSRAHLFKDSPLSAHDREAILDAFMRVCQWVKVHYLWRPNLKDEADNHLIELALAGNAETIITHNQKDFAQGELLFPSLRIQTAATFLNERKQAHGNAHH